MFINPSDTNNANNEIYTDFGSANSNAVQNPLDMLPSVLANTSTSFNSIAALNTAFDLAKDPSAMNSFASAMQTMQMMSGLQGFFSPFGMQSPFSNPMQNMLSPLQQDNNDIAAEESAPDENMEVEDGGENIEEQE